MADTIHIHCPVCNAADIRKIMSVKDHSVSQEEFDIYQCTSCMLRFTHPAPAPDVIGGYYKSENYISHTDTNKGMVNRMYQYVRGLAIRQKKRLIEKYTVKTSGSLLDVGSGTGYFISELKRSRWEVTGLEPDEGARAVAKKQHAVDLLPAEQLSRLPANSFDAITLWHVLEHMHDVQKQISILRDLLKENGKLFIAVPNYSSHDAAVYKEYWAAYDVPRHLYHFHPAAMKLLVKKSGLKLEDIRPMWFDSFYVCLLSSKYKYGKTNWRHALWTAIVSNYKAMKEVEKCSSLIYIISK